MLTIIIALAALAQPGDQAGGQAAPAPSALSASPAPPAPVDKVTCILTSETGSNRLMKTCHTRREWKALQSAASAPGLNGNGSTCVRNGAQLQCGLGGQNN